MAGSCGRGAKQARGETRLVSLGYQTVLVTVSDPVLLLKVALQVLPLHQDILVAADLQDVSRLPQHALAPVGPSESDAGSGACTCFCVAGFCRAASNRARASAGEKVLRPLPSQNTSSLSPRRSWAAVHIGPRTCRFDSQGRSQRSARLRPNKPAPGVLSCGASTAR